MPARSRPPLEPAAEQPLTEGRQAATAPEPAGPQFSMRQLSEPQLFAPQISVPQSFTSRDTATREVPPQESATNDAAPRPSAAKDTALRVTAPQVTAPQATAPQVAAPQAAAPQVAAPQAAAPQAAAPQTAAPQVVAPRSRAPGSRAPRIPRQESTRQDLATRQPAPARGRTRAAGGAERGDGTGTDEVGTASAGRRTARHTIPGRCTDPCAAPEASRARGADRETTCERSLECRAKIRRCPAGDSRELLCRRRYTAQDRHPAHLDPGRLLLLRTAIARARPSRGSGVSSPGSKR